jgi:hypothetical protein
VAREHRAQPGGRSIRGACDRQADRISERSAWKLAYAWLRVAGLTKPAYNIATGLPSSVEDARSIAPRQALLHGIPDQHRRKPVTLAAQGDEPVGALRTRATSPACVKGV